MNNITPTSDQVLLTLFDPRTIRSQSHRILNLIKQGLSNHFEFDPEQMDPTASFVIEIINAQYPTLDIPYHSRWRHFEVGGSDRIGTMLKLLGPLSSAEQGKILFELVIISVFLDAGAGPLWCYKEGGSGKEYTRSEGLALASLSLYQKGVLSTNSNKPLRVDAQGLIAFKKEHLIEALQVSAKNPLVGIEGRVELLNKLGKTIKENAKYFGIEGRLGNFYSYCSSLKNNNILKATALFQAVLNAFRPVWPVRLTVNGVSLGDVWTHRALKTDNPGSEYIPFHKLSQWLTYSLIEPLEQSEIKVTDLNCLTGLPEYRNGGLLIDTGLLRIKNHKLLEIPQDPGSEAIVEWRALTVALLDELALLIRGQLQKDAHSLPLAKILQGGTWNAGRQIAREKRAVGTPPIQIISDGTVF